MGRIFEKRKDRMFARWSKMAKAFTKIGKEISIAVKLGGPEPGSNPRLRLAIQTARAFNMPKDRIEAAVTRAASKDGADLQELSYEGYGPHGVAMLIDVATDNPTRTIANVRSIFNKHGGSMATAGALDFVFERKGAFTIVTPKGDLEEFELELIDHGLEELFETDDGLLIYTSFADFGDMQRALEERHVEVKAAGPQRVPVSSVELGEEDEAAIEKMIGLLEDDDDVQHVYHNMKYGKTA